MENPELEITQNIIETHGRDPSSLITILNEIQDYYHYLPKESLDLISRELHMSLAKIHGVLSFYAQFKLTKPGKHIIKVCHGTACFVKGAETITTNLITELGIYDGETTPDGLISLDTVSCLGSCAIAPVVEIDNEVKGKMNSKKLKRELRKIYKEELK